MMLQTYHLCQVVGQAFQAISSYKKCKILKKNKIIQYLFQTIFEKSPRLFYPSSIFFLRLPRSLSIILTVVPR